MCSDGVTSNHTSHRFDSILVIYLPTEDLVPLKCQSDIRYYTVEYDTSQISVLIPYISIGQQTTHAAPHHMMTSWIGNIFRVTGHCAGNPPIPNEFPAQKPVARSFDVFFDLRLNKRLSKQSRGWWFETPPLPLWRHRNDKNYSNGSRSDMLLIGSLLVVFTYLHLYNKHIIWIIIMSNIFEEKKNSWLLTIQTWFNWTLTKIIWNYQWNLTRYHNCFSINQSKKPHAYLADWLTLEPSFY